MFEIVKAQIEDYRRRGVEVIVLEATLLVEAGWTSLVDEVFWVTVASEAIARKRLTERSKLSYKKDMAHIRSQIPPEGGIKHADVVIDTECTLDKLKAKVEKFGEGLHVPEVDIERTTT